MLRFFLVFSIFLVSLNALSDTKLLTRADSFVKNGTKDDQFRAYNDYKNIYLRSVIDGNKKLRIRSLKGIIKSGKKLHIDISRYEKELNKLNPKPSKKIKKTKKIRVKATHKLKSAKFIDDNLVLTFDKKLMKNQVNYFKIYDAKKRRYRYVFDIHAILLKNHHIRKKGINRIKIAQFNLKTMRLVIEDSQKIKIRFKKDGKQLIIGINSKNNNTTKIKTIDKDTTPKRLDRNKTIVIDPGHGGRDPGAVGYKKYREKIIVYKVSRHLRNILKSRGYKVYMTRYRDKYIKLRDRTKYANKKKADIFISIHANAVARKNAKKVHGIECYFLSPSKSKKAEKVAAKENSADLGDMNAYGKKSFLNFLNHRKIIASNKLAIDLQRGMLGSLNKKYKGVHDGGVREGPFWVLVGAQMPAVLVEVGFISHPKEATRLVNDKYRKTIALGLADGIERYFANN
ncbi:MAG: N-acetylmuramoyl-L-alanine amidase [Campylobacterota bacterium]|nr:N-acetylmuramoyl-L-alanine amidase [Campylobacterota bacterium]